TPITKLANVEKFIGALENVYKSASKGNKTKAKLSIIAAARHISFSFMRKYVLKVLTQGDYNSLGDLQRKSLLLTSMHFMDPYNFDVERVQRCLIHYAVPDGRIIPFCAMNNIHRESVEKKFGIPIKDWQNKHKVEISQPI
ncbi:MAG: radical SAM protein, partial [Crenarchaeota archaeon]|nr:radical SAM protein [Thermoproteota archaeon]